MQVICPDTVVFCVLLVGIEDSDDLSRLRSMICVIVENGDGHLVNSMN